MRIVQRPSVQGSRRFRFTLRPIAAARSHARGGIDYGQVYGKLTPGVRKPGDEPGRQGRDYSDLPLSGSMSETVPQVKRLLIRLAGLGAPFALFNGMTCRAKCRRRIVIRRQP